MRLLHVEPVLLALPRGGHCRFERVPQRADGGIVFGGAERFPFARSPFDLFERVLAAELSTWLDHRRAARVQRRAPFVFGAAFGLDPLLLRDAAARPAGCRLEARDAVGVELESRLGRQRRPLGFGASSSSAACAAAGASDSTRATRLATCCCHASSASRLAASASSSACIIARALFATDLFFARAATVSRCSRSSPASFASTARSSAAIPASL